MFARMDVQANSTNSRGSVDPLELRAIDSVKNGRPEAYDYLVAKYMKRVVSISWGLVRNSHDAEDLARRRSSRRTRRSAGSRRASLWTVDLSHRHQPLARRPQHSAPRPQEELSDTQPAARRDFGGPSASTHEIGARIDAAIESLPEMQRIVARLHLVEQFEHSETRPHRIE